MKIQYIYPSLGGLDHRTSGPDLVICLGSNLHTATHPPVCLLGDEQTVKAEVVELAQPVISHAMR